MEIAECYGFNPFGLKDDELMALEVGIPRVKAKRFREAMQLHPEVRLSVDQIYDLVLAETDSRETAEYSAQQYIRATLRSGQTPI